MSGKGEGMLAVFESGGKQYCVRPGDVVKVEKLNDTGAVTFHNVLLATDGAAVHMEPSALAQTTITADVLETAKQKKVLVFKKKRRNNYRRLNGHRQTLTVVRIKDINLGGAKPKATQPAAKPKADASDVAATSAVKDNSKATAKAASKNKTAAPKAPK